MPKDFILRPIRGKYKERKLMSFDTEDDTRGNMLYGNIYDGEKHYPYKTPEQFISILRGFQKKYKRQKIFLVATNLEYDMVNSFKGHYDVLELMYAGRLINFKVNGTNIYGMDSLNHYKDGVKSQGERLGMGFEKIKIDTANLKALDINKVEKYCDQDSKITLAAMKKHQDAVNSFGADLKDTAAGTALNLFRRRFLKQHIQRPDERDLEFMKQGYYGGRCEIFNVELFSNGKDDDKIHYYDINSLYPYVMNKYKYPDPNTLYHGRSIDDEGISECTITVKDAYIPYLPFKYEFEENKGYRLMFPTGVLHGTWSNFELRYASTRGLIKIHSIKKSINFHDCNYYFKDYITYMYGERKRYKEIFQKNKKDTNAAYMIEATKLFMNSLYGKFFEHVDSKGYICDSGGIKEEFLKEQYYPKHSNGIWAAYVTAYARTEEYEALNRVVDKGGILGYCDTDCNIYKGKDNIFTISNDLGDLKEEGVYKYARFYLPKTYLLVDDENNGYITAKGIPANKNDDHEYFHLTEGWGLDEDPIKLDLKFKNRVEFLKTGKVRLKKPVRFKEASKSVMFKNRPNYWRYVKKEMKAHYLKRVIMKNGDTRPYKMTGGTLK